MTQKAKKRSKLRHAEYYDMQNIFDELYAKSRDGEIFNNLVEIIVAPNNIMLAFRNIKSNDGSHTAGTDGRTIESLADMSEEDFVSLIQKQFTRYVPKTVRRVEIPKPNGKLRPLGIPCIIDRIVQQCILQVMEPICEAKFYEHSYGFRPCRSAENAVSYAYGLAQRNKLHYVVDVDIKGFFDNVNHRKLLQQIWTLGIRDTKLIQIIKCAITGEHLEVIHCICYRKSNECKNGRDSYRNLLLLSPAGYEFISTTDSIKFATLTKKYDLNKAQITKVNKLRVAAGLAEMSM